MKRIRYLIFILMPMFLIGIFGMRANASNAPSINPNLKYSPELFAINEGQTTYAPNEEITEELSMNSDFYFYRDATAKTIIFRIYDINYFTYNFDYEVLVIDIYELASIFEERELVENRDFLEVQFIDEENVENPYYYEHFDGKYYIYIGPLENGAITRVDFTMVMTVQNSPVWTFNDQVFAHNTSIRFMKEWEDYLSIKEYYMLAIERDHNAHTNYQRGVRDGYNDGYQKGWLKGVEEEQAVAFQEGWDEGWGEGWLKGLAADADSAYQQGLKHGYERAEKHYSTKFMSGIGNWIVPAILIVVLLGGFIVIRSNRNRGE